MQIDKYFPGNIQHDIRTSVTRKSDANAVSTFSGIIAWFERYVSYAIEKL